MKYLKPFYISFILIFISAVTLAQNTETRSLSSFDEMKVGEGIKVYLKSGGSESAKIEASGIDLEDVVTDVSGDRLLIEIDNHRNNNRNISVTIYLTYKELEHITMSSAARVETENVLKTDHLEIDVSSAAKGKLDIDVNELEVDISSAGNLRLTGKATMQDIEISSAGDLDAYDLACDETFVSVSSAGNADVIASKKIEANASSGGHISYRGNPDKTYVNSSSGGSIKRSN